MATLAEIQTDARYGQIIIRYHADDRCDERGADEGHVKAAILSATVCIEQEAGKHRLEGGKDLHGDALTVVVRRIRRGLWVVTVF